MRLFFRLYLVLATFLLMNGTVASMKAQEGARIVVDTTMHLGPVNHLVFGQSIEAADSAHIFSSDKTNLDLIQRGNGFWDPVRAEPIPEIVEQGKAAGMSMLRYPGGCYAHNFDWRKTVGPEAKANGWKFGLDEYLSLCRTLNAEPLITLSDYVLSADLMPENAASLVEYLNSPADAAHPWAMKRKLWGHPEPYHVTWFELGNESMHGNHRLLPLREYTAEEYAAYANATAAAMRSVDPKVRIGILMVPGTGTDVNSNWNTTVLRLAGASADFIILHVYAPQKLGNDATKEEVVQTMMATPQHVEERLEEYHKSIEKYVGHDLPLAITEFNGAVDLPNYRFSYADALECADLLRIFLKPDMHVAMANYWQFLNGPFGMLLTTMKSPDSKPQTEEPALAVYKLWGQHFGKELVNVDVQSPHEDFEGKGSEEAAIGTTEAPNQLIQEIDFHRYSDFQAAKTKVPSNVQITDQASGFKAHVQNLDENVFQTLAQIPRPSAPAGSLVEVTMGFDARFTPDAGSPLAPMGVGLIDQRGWKLTHSGIGVDGAEMNWQHFEEVYRLTPKTVEMDLIARLMGAGKKVSGTLEVKNLKMSSYIVGHGKAYPLLTSSASVSGNKVYVMVINKSAKDAIPSDISLSGFTAASGHYWEVNSTSLTSSEGVTTNDAVLPLGNERTLTHVFPAHSITAIELSGRSTSTQKR